VTGASKGEQAGISRQSLQGRRLHIRFRNLSRCETRCLQHGLHLSNKPAAQLQRIQASIRDTAVSRDSIQARSLMCKYLPYAYK
jgi:hypothetical protein